MIFWYSGPPEVKSPHFALLVCPKLQYLSFATDLELLSELKFEKNRGFWESPTRKVSISKIVQIYFHGRF